MRKYALAALAIATVAILAGAVAAERPGAAAQPAKAAAAPSIDQIQVFGEIAGSALSRPAEWPDEVSR